MRLTILVLTLCAIGFGQTAVKPEVTLNWNNPANLEAGATAKIYRAPGKCDQATPTWEMVASAITGTTHKDSPPTTGVWCYVATLNGAGGESTHSNRADAAIAPPPMLNFRATVTFVAEISIAQPQ